MLSDHALAALRKAATLAHTVPSVRLRIRDGDRVILAVQPLSPPPPNEGQLRTLPPCAFRTAVARAHELRAAGQRLAFCGLPDDHDPVIDVALPDGGIAHAGGIYRVVMADQWLHFFATTLDLERCHDTALTGDGLDTHVDDPGHAAAVRVGFHHDGLTGVTLVHTASTVGDRSEAARRLDLLECLLARYGADELVAALAFS